MVASIINNHTDVLLSVRARLLEKFTATFGAYQDMDSDMYVSFEYSPGISLEISRRKNIEGKEPIQFSNALQSWLENYNLYKFTFKDSFRIYDDIEKFLNDSHEIIYIPAGRSMLSILSDALSFVLFNLKDRDKNLIDYCTTDYIQRVIKIKPMFKSDWENSSDFVSNGFLKILREKMEVILHGHYKFSNGDDWLNVAPDKDIKLSFASSGQQEVLWILNFIYYYLSGEKANCFIIEEPEAHLYPNSQKDIAEFIALAIKDKNECIITTHSPYILGALNNLIDAQRLKSNRFDISKLLKNENLSEDYLIERQNFSAYFVENGEVQDAMDIENGLIRNEMIDDASDKINAFADALFEIERGGKF